MSNIPTSKFKTITQKILSGFFILFLLVFTIFIGVKPYYNIDMLPYMAILQKMDGESSVEKIHATTYSEVEERAKPQEYADLTSSGSYRKSLYSDPFSFDEQLAFYVIKPLYLLFAFLFYKTGFSLSFSTVLPSLISFFLIGLILLRWIFKVLPSPWLAFWACLFVITAEPSVNLGKSSAPDGLATMLLLAGCYLFIEKKSLWGSVSFFVLSILARPDYIILICLIFLIVVSGKWYKKVAWPKLLLCFFLFFASYFVPKLFLDGVAWSVLYHHAFISRILYPLSNPQGVSFQDYMGVMAHSIVHSTYFARTYLLVMMLFAGVTFWERFKLFSFRMKEWSFNQVFMLALLFAIVARFFLFPAFLERFMAPFLILGFVIFLKEGYRLLQEKNPVQLSGFLSEDNDRKAKKTNQESARLAGSLP